MLELIIGVSLLLRNWGDAALVALLLVINAMISVVQDRRAAGAVDALRRRLQVNARVRRDHTWQILAARELVPGDAIRVRAGDIVPADARISDGTLTIDQSALTGESADVTKGPDDIAPSGAIVRQGEAAAVVVATGTRTSFGRTTELVQTARPVLHVERVVTRVVQVLFAIIATLLVGVAILAGVRGTLNLALVPFLLVLLLAAVPVALPVMFTVSMAVGSEELVRRGVLVTRLNASEDAAAMDTLCADKTGTLTTNQLVVTNVTPETGVTASEVLTAAALASEEADRDPIDLAVLASAKLTHAFGAADPPTVLSFKPFDPKTRQTEAIVALSTGGHERVVKGALSAVLSASAADTATAARLQLQQEDAARHGFRTLAVARAAESGPLAVIGLISLHDPPRDDARSLVDTMRQLGVSVRMLTGDALPVAEEIATELGLGTICPAESLHQASSSIPGSSDSPEVAIEHCGGFAGVYPEDKYLLVRRLQQGRHIVGMTGDGVNDAPALRQAEVGIAVSNATDVAKSAASAVLTEPGLKNIVSLIEVGRMIYQRVLTWIINKISRTILKASVVAIVFVVAGRFAVSALALLVIVFMTDFAKISLATDNVRWSREPNKWRLAGYVRLGVVLGLLMTAECLLFLRATWWRWDLVSSDPMLQTVTFELLVFLAAASVLSIRNRRWFWSVRPGTALAVALVVECALAVFFASIHAFGLTPLSPSHTAVVFTASLVSCLLINDFVKVLLYPRRS
jgi:H+-transporting ATPase